MGPTRFFPATHAAETHRLFDQEMEELWLDPTHNHNADLEAASGAMMFQKPAKEGGSRRGDGDRGGAFGVAKVAEASLLASTPSKVALLKVSVKRVALLQPNVK